MGGWHSEPCEHDNSSKIAYVKLQLDISVLYIKSLDEFDVDLFELSNLLMVRLPCEHDNSSTIVYIISLYRDILHIKILDEFDVDLGLPFLTF